MISDQLPVPSEQKKEEGEKKAVSGERTSERRKRKVERRELEAPSAEDVGWAGIADSCRRCAQSSLEARLGKKRIRNEWGSFWGGAEGRNNEKKRVKSAEISVRRAILSGGMR